MKEQRIRMMDYMVHLDTSSYTIYFDVYPITEYTEMGTGKEGLAYTSIEDQPVTIHEEQFDEKTCLKKLEGSFCWRGVWEGRLYFPDEEYWGEELMELAKLYEDHIVKWCKDFIKTRQPDHLYDD